jgi:hypothetical protein
MQRGSTISALAIASLALVLSSTSWATALNVNIHVQPPIVNAPAKTLPGYASTRGVHPLKDQPCQHAAGCDSTQHSVRTEHASRSSGRKSAVVGTSTHSIRRKFGTAVRVDGRISKPKGDSLCSNVRSPLSRRR